MTTMNSATIAMMTDDELRAEAMAFLVKVWAVQPPEDGLTNVELASKVSGLRTEFFAKDFDPQCWRYFCIVVEEMKAKRDALRDLGLAAEELKDLRDARKAAQTKQ